MKKRSLLLMFLLLVCTLGFSDMITLDSTGTSGSAARRVKTYVDFEETEAPDFDLMPFYICFNKVNADDTDEVDLVINEMVQFDIKNSNYQDWKQWASFDGSNDANTLKSWIDDGYSFNTSSLSVLPIINPLYIPASLKNAQYKPGTKTTGIDHIQQRIDDGKVNVLVAVINETKEEIYNSTDKKVTVCHFAKFSLDSTNKSGSNKWIKAKYEGLVLLDDLTGSKKATPKAAIEVRPN